MSQFWKALALSFFISFYALTSFAEDTVVPQVVLEDIQLKLMELKIEIRSIQTIGKTFKQHGVKTIFVEIVSDKGTHIRITPTLEIGDKAVPPDALVDQSVSKYLRGLYTALALPAGVTPSDIAKLIAKGGEEAATSSRQLEVIKEEIRDGKKTHGVYIHELKEGEAQQLKNASQELIKKLAVNSTLKGMPTADALDFSESKWAEKDFLGSRIKTVTKLSVQIEGIIKGINLGLTEIEPGNKDSVKKAESVRKTLLELFKIQSLVESMKGSLERYSRLQLASEPQRSSQLREFVHQNIEGRIIVLQRARTFLTVLQESYGNKASIEQMARFHKNILKLYSTLNIPFAEAMEIGASSKVLNYALELHKVIELVEAAEREGVTQKKLSDLTRMSQLIEIELIKTHTRCSLSQIESSSSSGKGIHKQEMAMLGKQLIMAQEVTARVRTLKVR